MTSTYTCRRRRREWRQRVLLICRGGREEITKDHFAQWRDAKVRARHGVDGFGLVARSGVGGVWIPRVCVDLEIGKGHGGHFSGEEAQIVVDHVEVLECM